jgi:hypothetical protein
VPGRTAEGMDVSQCRECHRDIVFGRTAAGKLMPMDPEPYPDDDAAANLAVYRDHTTRLNVRVITADRPLERHEHRAMPHFASCPARKQRDAARRGDLRGEGVIPFPKGGRP